MKKIFLFILPLFFLFSCTLNTENEGTLVVSNHSENTSQIISEIYVKERESSGYTKLWNGRLKNNSSEFICLKPGNYSVQIKVTEQGVLYDYVSTYTTGYNIYKPIREDSFVNVAFDGNGIYFE